MYVAGSYDAEELDRRRKRYEELCKLNVISIDRAIVGYAHKSYLGKFTDFNLTALDILIFCDRGNTCFGGVVHKSEDGTFRAEVYTD